MRESAVGVVIPTYNGEKFLVETLESIFSQTLRPEIIVIVDDCSTDSTTNVVRCILPRSPIPIKLIELDKNSGSPSRPTNVGIRACETEFIAVVDQDDILLARKLECEIAILRANSLLSLACSCCATTDKRYDLLQNPDVIDAICSRGKNHGAHWEIPSDEMVGLLLRYGCFPVGFPGFSFRRAAWVESGGVDETLVIADHDFLCKLALLGAASFSTDIGYLRRFHDANLSGNTTFVCRDYATVIRRYFRHALIDGHDRQQIGQICVGLSYFLRDRGYYVDACRCIHLAAEIQGWHSKQIAFLAKLAPHWLLHGWKNREHGR